ncbi:O-methyltransferase [Mycena belliarum]|uniref:O-methyltransferase n=1 Tax=Mycena belliarum TaxID=1033014 RepID=A0AAD6Y0M3_9AGAR|nr:O-methyltransferase [Mycena belliae]
MDHTNGTSSISTLRRLAELITQSVDTMERTYHDAGVASPSLDEPFDPSEAAAVLRKKPEMTQAVQIIVAAASQLIATVRDPVAVAFNSAYSFQVPACLAAASELNVVEILREGGSAGVHVRDIAAPSGASSDLLERILRLLATHHIFREVSVGVFANNRISSVLDKEKPSKALFQNREGRLEGTSGTAALVEGTVDINMRAATLLPETLLNPAQRLLPFNLAFKTEQSWFEFMQRPENTYRRKRFAVAMQGTAATDAPDVVLKGFDWGQLGSGAVVVDVGGGIGHASLAVARKHPTLRIINQDLGPTIELSKLHWTENLPEHVQSNLVEFQKHDFFGPQPVRNADVFLMRYVIHNWVGDEAVAILTRLREAATPTTRLVLVEKVVSSAAGDDHVLQIPGAARPQAPAPLLPNWGVAAAETTLFDLTMHNLVGGVERTVGGFVELLARAGWKLVRIHHCPPSPLSYLVSVPI